MKAILKTTCLIVLLLSLPVRIDACWWQGIFDWCGEPGDEFLITDDPASLSTLLSEYKPGNISQNQNYIISTLPFQAVSSAGQLDDFNSNTTIQYFDGLGRLSQTVQRMGSPGWDDLVTGVVYDNFGRESGEWLPAVIPQANEGAYVPHYQYIANNQAEYSEGNPFTITRYEPSPLNRVVEQYGPGKDWQSHAKSKKTVYDANGYYPTHLANNVKRFYIAGNMLKWNWYYGDDLYGTGSIDEDDKKVIEFTDKLGRKILTRAVVEKKFSDTYYVYDDFGNLRYVLPPLATDVKDDINASVSEAKGSPLDLYGYVYKYDERNRNVEKKLPGCEPVYMVYDKADRLIASQDGNQRTKHQWTVNKYDVFGRLLYTGIYTGNETREQLASLYSNTITNESYMGSSNTGGYSCANLTPSKMLTVNYYDNYGFLDWAPSIVFTRMPPPSPPMMASTGIIFPKDALTDVEMSGYTPVDKNHTKTLLTGRQVYHLNDFDYELTALYYDKYGHVVQTRSINHLNGLDYVYNEVDFLGKPLKTYKTHNTNGALTTELYTYTYDKGQRLLNTTICINGGMNLLLSANSYDELCRLDSKTIGNARTTINYTYNIRNWVTGITDKYFTESLSYNIKPLSGLNSYYNGNISFMQWSIPSENLGYNRAYSYLYDESNRLTTSYYYGVNNGSLIPSVSNKYYEYMSCDKMGCIKNLYRNENGSILNYLTFTYTGNHLKTVSDWYNATKPYGSEAFVDRAKLATEYAYDANGNMTWDANSGISTIQYNSLNLPDVIQFSEGHQNQYMYDAAGQKLNVTNYTLHNLLNVPQGTINPLPVNAGDYTKITTDYVGNMIYENYALKEILTPEGYWQNGVYYYCLKDHLGNTRVVIDGAGTIVEKSHYYPSGMRFQESTSNSAALPYRYGGKELEAVNGLNQYDFEARRRFASIPVTTTMDPLCENYYPVSPYSWCNNSFVNNIDSNGKDWYRHDESGSVIWQDLHDESVTIQDQSYRNIGETYSEYTNGQRTDYEQNEITSVTDVSQRFNIEGGEYIPRTFTTDDGTAVNVTFNYNSSTGGNGDKALSRDAVGLLITGVNEANNSGANITSVDVSTTTTGQHSTTSAHYVSNGARAFDIDAVNGVSVRNSKSHEQVNAIQNGVKINPKLNENYGPNIQERAGKAISISGHDNHIHISARRR